MRRGVATLFFCLACAVGLCGPQAADDDRPGYDEKLLREAGLTPSAEALTKFFTERTGSDADLQKIDGLIRQLGSGVFAERERASARLVALGPAAAPALLCALSDKEQDVRSRAKECFLKIQDRYDVGTCILAGRVLARLSPEKAPAVLLGRVPFAWPDEREAIWLALAENAARGGPLEGAYGKAVSDSAPARRALAGFMLARWGGERERRAAAALLKDADREVRLRVAQGLLGAGSPQGVPALIGLLRDTPDPVSWQAEELLRWWAGEDGPKPGGDWAAWWKTKPAVRAAKRAYRPRLLLVGDGHGRKVQAWLCGCDGRPRWQLTWEDKAPPGESDFLLLPDSSLVVAAEWSPTALKNLPGKLPGAPEDGWVVTARDLKGTIRWRSVRRGLEIPLLRLSTGTVWAGGPELTPEGAEVRLSPVKGILERWYKRGPGVARLQLALPYGLPGRRWVFRADTMLTPQPRRSLVEIDEKDGRERRQVEGTAGATRYAPLGDGHWLEVGAKPGEAREVDSHGRVVWKYRPERGVVAAVRLPGGNRVVFGSGEGGGPFPRGAGSPFPGGVDSLLQEVGPGGEVVWRAKGEEGPRSLAVCLPLVGLGF
jgi:hypothetical protein